MKKRLKTRHRFGLYRVQKQVCLEFHRTFLSTVFAVLFLVEQLKISVKLAF